MCIAPVPIKNNPYRRSMGIRTCISVPCGHCIDCKVQYQNQWKIRLVEQFRASGLKAVFATLTYRNDVLKEVDLSNLEEYSINPETHQHEACNCVELVDKLHKQGKKIYSVCARDVQLWIKAMRIDLDRKGLISSKDLKFFVTSEYGPTTLRPHYHLVLFGVTRQQVKPYFDKWRKQYGFYTASDILHQGEQLVYDGHKFNPRKVNAESAFAYVAKYCSKGMFENPLSYCNYVDSRGFKYISSTGRLLKRTPIVEPTFHLVSKGLGKAYLDTFNPPPFMGKKYDQGYYRYYDSYKSKRVENGITYFKTIGFTRLGRKYSDSYLDYCYRNHRYVSPYSPTNRNGETLYYALPRYYKFAKNNQNKILYDANLQSQMQDYICRKNDELYNQKLTTLHTQNPTREINEIALELEREQERNQLARYTDREKSLSKFYAKSKL